MLERERINRLALYDPTIKEGYFKLKDSCNSEKADLYDCLVFQQKRIFGKNKTLNNATKSLKRNTLLKNATRRKILNKLNKGNVNTLQNAKSLFKENIGLVQHTPLSNFKEKKITTGKSNVESGLYPGKIKTQG